MELWKDIQGYEGLYQISNMGNVKSLLFKEPRHLRPILNNAGYYQVSLKCVKYLVHRLVAIAFIENTSLGNIINHKDNNPKNNCVGNLEWCTPSYNSMYSVKKNGSNNSNATIDEETAALIFQLSKNTSTTVIARDLQLKHQIVYNIVHGRTWTHVTGLPRRRYYSINRKPKNAA